MKRSTVAARDEQALRLAAAVSKLRTGLRDARWQVTDLSITQFAILRNLDGMGSMTASGLAAIEHVSPQAIAQQLAGLKERGYIDTHPDPDDGRKTVISLTDSGRALLQAVLESREAWLAQAIGATVTWDERADLDRAIDVLERLAVAVARRKSPG
jgi:DNA-binding MarR family transcriptional regulator